MNISINDKNNGRVYEVEILHLWIKHKKSKKFCACTYNAHQGEKQM